MQKLPLTLFSLALVLAASAALSCGTTSLPAPTGGLQSITISPATAATGDTIMQVQFTATGHYNGPPYTLTPQPATWGACYQNAPTDQVSVTSSGLAQCAAPGPNVTYSVFAFDQTNCNLLTACGGGCTVVGAAQLTCSDFAVEAIQPDAPGARLPSEPD
jgi:hypothetical protein